MRWKPRSLQGRLLALVLGVVISVWLAAAAMTWRDVRHELDELLDGHLAQAAALLVVQQAGELGDDHDAADAPALHRYAPKVAFQVFHEGRLVLRSHNAPALPMTGAGQSLKRGFWTAEIEGVEWRVFAAQGAERDVQVYVSERIDSRGSILWAVLRSTLWPMLMALPLLALASWWAVYSGMGSLRRLGRTLGARQPQALQPVMLAGAPSEMVPLVEALNGLFERIGRMIESERRFTADAAHELRTPIAAIRAQAQVALGENEPGPRRHALEATLQGCDRATRLVEQLLVLSRLEAGAAPATPVQLDLPGLVRSVMSEAAPRAIRRGQTIQMEGVEACPVLGDAILLAVLVRNLIDNAIRYSPPGASVKVSVPGGTATAVFRVEDSGPGMTGEEIERLGERFYRVLGTGQGGSGLGWSIVRRIAALHNASVEVRRSAELGGLAVEIGFPAAAVAVHPAPRTSSEGVEAVVTGQ